MPYVKPSVATRQLGIDRRVSTRKQLPYLRTQLATLSAKYPDHRVISDCASGLNYKRRGLQEILQLAFAKRLRAVRVSHKDRLCRFGFDLIEYILKADGATIVVETDHSYTAEEDLAHDVMSVITVFGARLHGKRSGASHKQETKNKRQRSATNTTTSTRSGETKETATIQTTDRADRQPANIQGPHDTHKRTSG